MCRLLVGSFSLFFPNRLCLLFLLLLSLPHLFLSLTLDIYLDPSRSPILSAAVYLCAASHYKIVRLFTHTYIKVNLKSGRAFVVINKKSIVISQNRYSFDCAMNKYLNFVHLNI